MKYCINCGSELQDEAAVCPDCGVNQSKRLESGYRDRDANEMYCSHCGEIIYREAELCPECGGRQRAGLGKSAADNSEQVAAGILAILVGGLGVHKFYQGNTRNGVLYLCFFWTAIPAVLGLIEGILMLMADVETYEREYADGSILGS